VDGLKMESLEVEALEVEGIKKCNLLRDAGGKRSSSHSGFDVKKRFFRSDLESTMSIAGAVLRRKYKVR
jgi:hypothetical protein